MVHQTGPGPALGVPAAARRVRGPGWRDPRLWVGVLVVAVSVVLGARVLAAADDTVEVWAAATDLGPGQVLSAADLEAVRVRFPDPAALERYLPVSEALPADVGLDRPLGAGELVARSALGEAGASGTVQVAVAVDDVRVPSAVGPGSVVDVYLLSGGADGARAPREERVLEAVTVLASTLEEGFGVAGRRKLELAVPADDAPGLFAVLAGDGEPVLSVARRS